MAPKFEPKPAAKPAPKPETPTSLEAVAELTQQRYEAGRFAPKDASELSALASTWYLSGLLPAAYYPPLKTEKTPKGLPFEARWNQYWRDRGTAMATIVMRFGSSLGVLPEQAIRSIYVVEGQPHPSAQLMLALAISNGVLRRDDYKIEATKTACTLSLFTRTRLQPEVVVAKYEEYKHLHGKTNWMQYSEDMLVARAISRAMRRYFPDVFHGVYAAEEAVDFDHDRATAVERILSSVETGAPPGDYPDQDPGDAAHAEVLPPPAADEYQALVAHLEGLIEALPHGTPEDDPRAAEILGLSGGLAPAEKIRLGAAFRTKVPNGRP